MSNYKTSLWKVSALYNYAIILLSLIQKKYFIFLFISCHCIVSYHVITCFSKCVNICQEIPVCPVSANNPNKHILVPVWQCDSVTTRCGGARYVGNTIVRTLSPHPVLTLLLFIPIKTFAVFDVGGRLELEVLKYWYSINKTEAGSRSVCYCVEREDYAYYDNTPGYKTGIVTAS